MLNAKQELIDRLFPKIDSGIKPTGNTVIIQGIHIPEKRGGIILTQDYRDTEAYDVQVGMIVAMGPLAYKNKTTLEPWKEGNWAEVGAIVSLPRSGFRINRKINGEKYNFILITDAEVNAEFTDLDGFSVFDV